uniref:Uncharacterized protein n=1 Tax=Glossina brevipalpis TaxID=37001 RepID=A0A1A9WDK5_9MUSC
MSNYQRNNNCGDWQYYKAYYRNFAGTYNNGFVNNCFQNPSIYYHQIPCYCLSGITYVNEYTQIIKMQKRNMSPACSKPQTSAEAFCRQSRPPIRHTERPTLRNLNPIFRKRDPSEDNTILTEKLLKLARLRGELNLSSRALATGEYLLTNII